MNMDSGSYPHPAAAEEDLTLSGGSPAATRTTPEHQDRVKPISRIRHPHVWQVDGPGHGRHEWRNDLYYCAHGIFADGVLTPVGPGPG